MSKFKAPNNVKQFGNTDEKIEEAKKRDHRKLGRELDLFTILDEAPGMPFFFTEWANFEKYFN